MSNKLRLAVLISGGGRTLQNFIDVLKMGRINASIRAVISSSPDAYGLKRAAGCGVETHVVDRAGFGDTDEFSRAVIGKLDSCGIDLVLMAGFFHFLNIPDRYAGKVMNIHPSLIPSFCGQGFYGHHVHKAVIDYGAKISGCTVHFVDNRYDNGPVILQRSVLVMDDDTPETLAARVFVAECDTYPEAVRLFAEGQIEIVGRKVNIGDIRWSR